MENNAAGDQHAEAAQGLQQQVNYLQQQLAAQNQLFAQQQQFLQLQANHMVALAAGNQPRPRAAEPHKVKIPPIWTTSIRSWFVLAESQFGTFAVENPRQQFDLVVAALNDDARMHARAVVENAGAFQNPYVALRERLMEVYQPSIWQEAAQLLQMKELGDRKPSDQMDAMLALVPNDLSIVIKAIFLGSLPVEMRDHVQQGAERLSYQQLAARADSIWDARQAKRANVVAAVAPPPEDQNTVDVDSLEQVLAAVRFSRQPPPQKSAKPSSTGKKDGKSSQPKKSSSLVICGAHLRWGFKARKCEDPSNCQYPKN